MESPIGYTRGWASMYLGSMPSITSTTTSATTGWNLQSASSPTRAAGDSTTLYALRSTLYFYYDYATKEILQWASNRLLRLRHRGLFYTGLFYFDQWS